MVSLPIIGHDATFDAQLTSAGGGGSSAGWRYLASWSVRGSRTAGLFPSFIEEWSTDVPLTTAPTGSIGATDI
jgi:hypothetical protein